MSGGHFDYVQETAMSEIFGWDDKPRNVFEDKEISELVFDVLNLIHDFDWYASGDTCEETWLEKKAKFKKKWFETQRKDRTKRIIDETIADARNELYKTYGIEVSDGNES